MERISANTTGSSQPPHTQYPPSRSQSTIHLTQSANIFLSKDGQAKLGDLNVSKVAKNGLLYTQTGTPYYASPEVWKDEPYDAKSDIWSLGCVIYEMTTLEPPFQAEDMEGLMKAVTLGMYPPINAKFSRELAQVIKMMLQQHAKKRPTADALLASSLVQQKIEELNLDTYQMN